MSSTNVRVSKYLDMKVERYLDMILKAESAALADW